MRLEIAYTTQYTFRPLVFGGLTAIRMMPRQRPGLIVHRADLSVSPGTRTMSFIDGWGTRVDVIESPPHEDSSFVITAQVETGGEGLDDELTPAQAVLFSADSGRVRRDAVSPLLQQLGLGPDGWASVETLITCLRQWFTYRIGVTDATTDIETVLRTAEGVCQDVAHICLAVLRSWGWCARYVSGYVYTGGLTPGRIEAGAMHAWVEVFRPAIGWVGVDPTYGGYADDRYVMVGAGRDYDDVRPVRGIISGVAEQQQTSHLVVARTFDQQ